MTTLTEPRGSNFAGCSPLYISNPSTALYNLGINGWDEPLANVQFSNYVKQVAYGTVDLTLVVSGLKTPIFGSERRSRLIYAALSTLKVT